MPERDVATAPRPGDVVTVRGYTYEVLVSGSGGVRVKVSHEKVATLAAWSEAVRDGAVVIRGGEPSPSQHQ